MIVPDVNVLVYAFRTEADRHAEYARWLNQVQRGTEPLGLTDLALTGFLRVVTNPRAFPVAAPCAVALEFVEALRAKRATRPLVSTAAVWSRFRNLVDADLGIRANLVPDAWLAAMTISHGGRLATADRGFARFPGLDWFDPAT